MYHVMHAYGSLALEVNSEVGEVADLVFSAPAPGQPNSQPQRQTHSSQWGLPREDFFNPADPQGIT